VDEFEPLAVGHYSGATPRILRVYCNLFKRNSKKGDGKMFTKKFLLVFVLIFVVGAFMALAYGEAQAAGSKVKNSTPLCYPIQFPMEGHWGMSCTDSDNNITSVELQTNSSDYHLIWDNTFAEMIVQFDGNPEIYWQVCDGGSTCVDGTYPTP
jgi:hypothetical protein